MAKRWWVDDATGVLLWQESYDDDGAQHGRPASPRSTVVPYAAVGQPRAATRLPGDLGRERRRGRSSARSGWSCSDEMAGLDLLEVSTDTPTDPRSMHAVYGDGVSTVSVLQRHGRLSGAPAGARWDGTLAGVAPRRRRAVGDAGSPATPSTP